MYISIYAIDAISDKAKRWMRSDSGSTTSAQRDVELLDNYDFQNASPIGAHTTAGVYERVDKLAKWIYRLQRIAMNSALLTFGVTLTHATRSLSKLAKRGIHLAASV